MTLLILDAFHTLSGASPDQVDTNISESTQSDPDKDVVELINRGCGKAAITRLMERHGVSVYRYCCSELRDPVLAEDVHQQVFAGAFRDLPRFAGRSSLRAWLFAIARHRVLDAIKQRDRQQARSGELAVDDEPDPGPPADDTLDDRRLTALLSECVAELDPEARSAVLLYFQQGFTFDEMAKICRCKPGTLQARVARALPRLRAMIEARLTPAPTLPVKAAGRRSRAARRPR